MQTSQPTVADYMSPCPRSIGKGQMLTRAHAMMRKWRIRHLPVLDGRRVVGLLSLRDLHLIESLKDVDPGQVPVEDAMTSDPYTVTSDAGLRGVALEMAARKLGSALVMRNGEILGIFTTTDALNALTELLDPGPATRARGSRGSKKTRRTS